MKKENGIPKEIIDKLDITSREKQKAYNARVIIEEHQAKIVIPTEIRLELGLVRDGDKKKSVVCLMEYDGNRTITCKF